MTARLLLLAGLLSAGLSAPAQAAETPAQEFEALIVCAAIGGAYDGAREAFPNNAEIGGPAERMVALYPRLIGRGDILESRLPEGKAEEITDTTLEMVMDEFKPLIDEGRIESDLVRQFGRRLDACIARAEGLPQ
jgi:hypothetical protein